MSWWLHIVMMHHIMAVVFVPWYALHVGCTMVAVVHHAMAWWFVPWH